MGEHPGMGTQMIGRKTEWEIYWQEVRKKSSGGSHVYILSQVPGMNVYLWVMNLTPLHLLNFFLIPLYLDVAELP